MKKIISLSPLFCTLALLLLVNVQVVKAEETDSQEFENKSLEIRKENRENQLERIKEMKKKTQELQDERMKKLNNRELKLDNKKEDIERKLENKVDRVRDSTVGESVGEEQMKRLERINAEKEKLEVKKQMVDQKIEEVQSDRAKKMCENVTKRQADARQRVANRQAQAKEFAQNFKTKIDETFNRLNEKMKKNGCTLPDLSQEKEVLAQKIEALKAEYQNVGDGIDKSIEADYKPLCSQVTNTKELNDLYQKVVDGRKAEAKGMSSKIKTLHKEIVSYIEKVIKPKYKDALKTCKGVSPVVSPTETVGQ